MQLGPMSEIFRAWAAVHPVDTLKPGDFYINNDPYGGGQHLQDVFIYSPIFYKGELVAFAGTTARRGEWRDAPAIFQAQLAATMAAALGLDYRAAVPEAGQAIELRIEN